MQFLILTIGIAASVWAVAAILRGSVFLSTALFLISVCVFPAEFFSVDVAGLTWTLDRVWFLTICAQSALLWYRGEQAFSRFTNTDVTIGLFLLWITARTLTQPLGSQMPGQPNTLMHLVNGYIIPFTLYGVLRTAKLDIVKLKPALILMCLLGLYLGATAFLEVARMWALVFPKFIGDPELGIHFGRARGPMLQSVRLGICLIACWLGMLIYTVWLKPTCRYRWLAALACTPLMCGAVFLTYTRSIWMGLGSTICLLVTLCLAGQPRRVAMMGLLAGVTVIGVIKGPDLIAFKREFSAAETRESTYMRAAFAYVSIEMFKDKPVAGFGFNQFQIYNRPYLSDRSTDIRLESIRGYVHHNSYLSLLVDLGIVGVMLYAFVMLAFTLQIMALWNAKTAPKWARGLAVIALAMSSVHVLQMAFHEVSFSPIENGFLFSILGLVVAAREQFAPAPQLAPQLQVAATEKDSTAAQKSNTANAG